MAGMLAGGAAGSSVGPVGTAVGGLLARLLVTPWLARLRLHSGNWKKRALTRLTAAVKSYLDKNGDSILGETAVGGR